MQINFVGELHTYVGPDFDFTIKRRIFVQIIYNYTAIMPIITNLDIILAKRKITLSELAERVGISIVNLSVLKSGKARAIRFSTLEAICEVLDCQPGDIIEYRKEITL